MHDNISASAVALVVEACFAQAIDLRTLTSKFAKQFEVRPTVHAGDERFAKFHEKHLDDLFTLLHFTGADATNWRGEQAIRPAVVIEVTETIDPRQRVEYRLDAECDEVIVRASHVLTPVRGRTELTRGVGIRPMRNSVRIERDPMLTNLFHCYGHGGSGLTLSWDSADRIVDLIQSTKAKHQKPLGLKTQVGET